MKKTCSRHTRDASDIAKSISSLASGIADDFNNILTTVLGACSIIDRLNPVNNELLQCVTLIRSSAEHAATLSGQLMLIGTHGQKGKSLESRVSDFGNTGTSVRDKTGIDDIVSSNNHPVGASQ